MPPRHGILGCHAFDRALGGPFNSLPFDPVLSVPDSLYRASAVFISASTVFELL
jgi:hypothetical protein